MINLTLHKEIHSRLMQRKHPTLLWGSPFDNAWVGFVLYDHRIRDEINLNEILKFFERWIYSTPILSILKEERNIGALSLYAGIASNLKNKESIKEICTSVSKRLIELDCKEKGKFTLFNSPEIFYATATGLVKSHTLREDLRKIFLKYVVKEAENNWFNKIYRFVLYSAAAFELRVDGLTNKIINFLVSIDIKELDIDEVIPLLWFVTRYDKNIFENTKDTVVQKLIEDKRQKLWEQFENQRTYFFYNLVLSEDVEAVEEIGTIYSLSTFELAMIDDLLACLEKVYKIDPNMVFDLLQLHPVIKNAGEKLFKDGHYTSAIFEVYKALINYVKEKSGEMTLDGLSLMAKVFNVKYNGRTLDVRKKPILQLNELRTREDMDEQKGFMHLFIGSVLGIRNPKAHGIIEQKDPFKTLEYLAFASLLAKRVDEAKLNR